MTTTLGVASLGLGLTELLAPKRVAALSGTDDDYRSLPIIRALGVRECGHGAAVLLSSGRLVWTRVVGDALDLAVLLAAASRRRGERRRRGLVTAAAIAGITLADVYATARIRA
ncbi:malate dehydrogenase [Mycolicibacterium sp. Dal123E01]|uniref:malate dehydrogenase n=1 Tax=Mycolicibacterium sp. Dal123E01 TaxID=3457578 RepID=UPI00403E879B